MARKGRLKTNLFVKPNAQRQSREDLIDAMARKGRMKFNLFVKPNAQRQSREDLSDAMARKGRLKTNYLPASAVDLYYPAVAFMRIYGVRTV